MNLDIDNDVYYCTRYGSKIIINNNYKGLYIINDKLVIEKRIDLFKDIIIYSGYTSVRQNKCVLFCPDNSCIVYVDIEKDKYYKINISEDIMFSPRYYFLEDKCFVSDYNGTIYEIYKDSISIKNENENFIEYPKKVLKYIDECFIDISRHAKISVYEKNGYISQYRIKDISGRLDYSNEKLLVTEDDEVLIYDNEKIIKYSCKKGYFIASFFINENIAVISDINGMMNINILKENDFDFVKKINV